MFQNGPVYEFIRVACFVAYTVVNLTLGVNTVLTFILLNCPCAILSEVAVLFPILLCVSDSLRHCPVSVTVSATVLCQ